MAVYAKNEIWLSNSRRLCELQEDGTVIFAEDATMDELKQAIADALRQHEIDRQRRIEERFRDATNSNL
jgi:hypothetical protein